jgi:hypothetical protein
MTLRPGAWFAALLPIPALLLLGFGSPGARRNRLLGLLMLWVTLAGLIVIPACSGGSGGNGGGGGGGGGGGTPAGAYTITITGKDANGAAQSNTAPTVQITVN